MKLSWLGLLLSVIVFAGCSSTTLFPEPTVQNVPLPSATPFDTDASNANATARAVPQGPYVSTYAPPVASLEALALPTFVPDYPCALENVDVYNQQICRRETVQERAVSESDRFSLIARDYSFTQGCGRGINYRVLEVRLCERNSGQISILTRNLVGDIIPSPDGEWYAFASQTLNDPAMPAHIYRVNIAMGVVQIVDTLEFPVWLRALTVDGWSDDQAWIYFNLWDGTETGWFDYQIRVDGSGFYEPAIID